MRPTNQACAIAALSVPAFAFICSTISGLPFRPRARLCNLSQRIRELAQCQWIAAWHLVPAGTVVATLPTTMTFFIMPKHFIASLTLGAFK
jgi:multiple sugar transport system permease protein